MSMSISILTAIRVRAYSDVQQEGGLRVGVAVQREQIDKHAPAQTTPARGTTNGRKSTNSCFTLMIYIICITLNYHS
jgi:hypothetical protein